MKLFIRVLVTGLLAGAFLGVMLKIVEQLTGEKVFILLINVDYIPVMQDWKMTGEQEFMLHLLVSVVLVFVLYFSLENSSHQLVLYIVINTAVGGLLFLTTTLSERTPNLTDMGALLYWLIAHSTYGLLVGYILAKSDRGVT